MGIPLSDNSPSLACIVCGKRVYHTSMLRHLSVHERRGESVNWEEYRRIKHERLSVSMAGNRNGRGNLGHVQSEEQKQAHSERMTGRVSSPAANAKRSATLKARWAQMSPAEREVWLENSRPSGSEPSGLELQVHAYLDEHDISYVAHPWVHAEGHTMRPDLVLSERLVVEVMGCYWHGCESCFGDRALQKHVVSDANRRAILERAGYEVVWLWEHDILDQLELLLSSPELVS